MSDEPKIRWNKGFTPKSVPLSDLLPDEDDVTDALPPPVVYTDDDGVANTVPANYKGGDK